MSTPRFFGLAPAAVVLLLAVSGCVDEQKVFQQKPFFQQPPANAGGYLGYTDTASQAKQTACGNCHVSHQAGWKETAHAHAWIDRDSAERGTPACQACHTVAAFGNDAPAASVAWSATGDPRYLDVQCEACHGAGLDHVTSPDAGAKPLASIAADTGAAGKTGCSGCHSAPYDPMAEQWRPTKHANLEPTPVKQGGACLNCHTGQGALAAWGVTAKYKEMNATGLQQVGVTCAVCHDPHSSKFEGQTRYATDAADTVQNLCMRCHQKRATPDATTSYGAHSPEGPMLLGLAGWYPPNATFKPGDLTGTHATGNLCVTCHMSDDAFATDAAGNPNTGHTFQAIPCVTGNGQFLGGSCDDSQRSFAACATGGCHGSDDAARSAYQTAEMRINALVAETNRLIALVPKSEFKAGDNVITVGEGAAFNVSLAQKPGAVAHNPFLLEALLTTSIQALKTQYSLTSTSGLSLQHVLHRAGN